MVARRVLFRLHTAMVAVLFCVSALALPSHAVSPQEGWFVRARETITANGKTQDYFIIDNKMTSDPWYVELETSHLRHRDKVIFSNSFTGKDYTGGAVLNEYYRGYSDVPWVIDNDWLMGISVSGLTPFVTGNVPSSIDLRLYCFDINKLPLFYLNPSNSSYGAFVSVPRGVLLGNSSSTTLYFGNGYKLVDGVSTYLSLAPYGEYSTQGAPFLYDYFSPSPVNEGNFSTINGSDINDIVVAIAANFSISGDWDIGTWRVFDSYARVAIHWAVPVSKCPADTAVGDRWPKVAPIDVQFEDKYESWKDAALANSPVTDADNVDDMISGYNDQLASSTELGSDAAEAWDGITPMLAVVEPFSPFLLLASGLFILAFFIKKGMG